MNADSLTSYLHNSSAIGNQQANYHTTTNKSGAFIPNYSAVDNTSSNSPVDLNKNFGADLGNSHHDNSLTFKSVGPDVDSTVDSSGVKYTQKYKINKDSNEKSHSVGYYGKSRLTR